MKLLAEALLIISLPVAAIILKGSDLIISMLVMGALGLALVILLSLAHHQERSRLDWTKFAEYGVLTVIVVVSYLFLV